MQNRPRVFRDPIHGLIRIDPGDEFLMDLIDSAEFQRLRRVRQLGVSSLTYPGAEHTRFNHSLGVLHVAQRTLEMLKRRSGNGGSHAPLITEKSRVVKAAALLHDVGHGAFSHLIERAFPSTADHEKRSQGIINGTESSISAILNGHGVEPEEVADIVGKRFKHRFLQDIVSSQLDSDRMDYLLRDAHFTGVRYGIFDLEWLINAMCLGNFPISDEGGSTTDTFRLCLDTKRGLHSAEQLLMARQHMSLQVYYHKATRRWEAHLLCLFREAARLAETSTGLPSGTPRVVQEFFSKRGEVTHNVFLQVDEPMILAAISIWASESDAESHSLLKELASSYLRREKIFILRDLEPSAAAEAELRMELEKLGPNESSRWELDYSAFSAYKMPSLKNKEEDPDGYAQSVASTAILLADDEGHATPAQESSKILETLGAAEKPGFLRLFLHPDLQKPVDTLLNRLNLISKN